jgi:pimeloyl-ACP methyl ester carboxylesterase
LKFLSQNLAGVGAYFNLCRLTGGEHDLIAFDPRGTGNAIPFSCGDAVDSVRLTDKQIVGDASDVALGTLWAVSGVTANACFEEAKDIGAYINTAFVARDLMSVAEALDDDGMLRYWGMFEMG